MFLKSQDKSNLSALFILYLQYPETINKWQQTFDTVSQFNKNQVPL